MSWNIDTKLAGGESYGDEDSCKVCGCSRVAGLFEPLQIKDIPTLLSHFKGPLRLYLQRVVCTCLHIFCVFHIAAPQPDLLTWQSVLET